MRSIAKSSRRNSSSTLLLAFLVSCIALDVSFGIEDFKFGNVVFLGGVVFCIVRLKQHGERVGVERLFFADWVYIAYLIYLLITGFWSPSAFSTFGQVTFLGLIWYATVLLGSANIVLFTRYMVNAGVTLAVMSFGIAIMAPGVAYQPSPSGEVAELRGVFHHQLRFGAYMGMALGALILAALNGHLRSVVPSRWLYLPYAAILFVALYLAYARLYTASALGALVVAIAFSASGWKRHIVWLATVAFFVSIFAFGGEIIEFLDDAGVDTTLTGRTTIWEFTLIVAADKPWLGYGFPSFDHSSFDWMWPSYRPAHPHNSFIQAFFETGFVGLVLVFIQVAAHFRSSVRSSTCVPYKFSYSVFFVVFTILGSLTGANYAAKPSVLFAYMLLVLSMERTLFLKSRLG